MIVRPAQLPDLVWLRTLYGQAVQEQDATYPSYTQEDLTSFTSCLAGRLDVDPNLLCWVAEDGAAVVGFALGEILSRLIGHPRRYASFQWVYVVPTYREKGVARRLSLAVVRAVKEKGVDTLEGWVAANDTRWPAKGWCGWQVTGTIVMISANALAMLVLPHTLNGHDTEVEEGA